ncbi:MAG: ankyrin repeat domain-containing protein [Gemmatimonadaceae bacterium]
MDTRYRPRRAVRVGIALVAAAVLSAAAPGPAESPVADAAMRRDTTRVRLLLKQGADVNAAQGDGMTALHWAATHGDAVEARVLIYAGARVEASTRNGNYTPLLLASRSGNGAVVKVLLEGGANPNAATTSGGATPLHLAAAEGDVETLIALLDHKAEVNAREVAFGQTPLMWAAAYNRVGAIQLLIARGADLKAVSKIEDIAAREKAERAALALRTRRVAALKAAEQPPKAAGAGAQAPGSSAAIDSAKRQDAAVAKTDAQSKTEAASKTDAHVKKGPDSTVAKASAGQKSATPEPKKEGAPVAPKSAADSAKAAAADRGLSYGDLVGNKGGLTSLLFAVREGNVDAVKALLKAGADINQVSEGDHSSALLLATINGHFDLAKVLLESGASPKLASDAGATPLYATINVQWAAKSLYPQPTAQLQQETTYLQLMEQLLKAGADPNARLTKHLWYMSYNFDLLGVNTDGATPFWRAAYGTDVPAMRLLLANGADPKIATRKPSGRQRGDDAPSDEEGGAKDQSGLPPVAVGGPGVYPIHAASGAGYGEGYAANSHRHAPDGWMPSVKFLIEELGADVNARDFNGYTPLHHAAARGDNEMIRYLIEKGADIAAVSRKGQTTADMANGPVQRTPPFVETVALLEKLGSKNNHKCKSC